MSLVFLWRLLLWVQEKFKLEAVNALNRYFTVKESNLLNVSLFIYSEGYYPVI